MKEKNPSDAQVEAIVAYHENRLTQSQAEILIEWLSQDDNNRKYLIDSGKIWHAAGLLKKGEKDAEKGWLKLMLHIREYDERPVPKKAVRIPVRNLYLIAASIALLITVGALGLVFFGKPGNQRTGDNFEALAPKGSRSVITLSDGSKVWLNSGTKLRYRSDFGVGNRDLSLEGEAYFSVTANKDMPFRVKAGEVCITALGTAFNVKAYSDENVVETTLEKGEVAVEHLSGSGGDPNASHIILKPNQKAVYIRSSGKISVDEASPALPKSPAVAEAKPRPYVIKVDTLVDTKLSTSWKDSRWIFRKEMLHDLAPILERRYDIDIVFRDTVLNDFKFTGTLREESLEQVLKAMTLAAPIRYEVSHNTVFLYVDQSQRNKYLRQPN
jgi:transmembrane sensor